MTLFTMLVCCIISNINRRQLDTFVGHVGMWQLVTIGPGP